MAEKDSAHHKALAESALRVAKGWEDKCGEMRAALFVNGKGENKMDHLIDDSDRLKPCPFCGGEATFDHDDNGWHWIECLACGASTNARVSAMGECESKPAGLPGAQPAPSAVAYLDLGVGGYMDIGTEFTDEELATLPKGRHMLGIVGTYGVDGYVPAQPAPSMPDVDSLAQFIREVDGSHQLGAGVLAERIAEWLKAAKEAKP